MVDATTGFGKAFRLGMLLLAGLASPALHAQGMVGAPVNATAPTGVPTISGNPTRMLVAGSSYDFRPTAADPNGDRLTFSINKLPRWATFDSTTGHLSGTPVTSDVGKIKNIVIAVSDGTNTKSLTKFSIKVVAGKPPTIAGAPGKDAKEGEAYSFQPAAADSDMQKLEYGIINKPTWAAFDKTTGRLSGTPPKGSAGAYASIGISVTDGANTASLAPFTITVAATPNAAPKISGTPPTSVQVGQVFDFVPAASDPDGDTLKFSIVNRPGWASFDAATGRLTGKPATGNEGSYADIVISVSDGPLITFLPPFSVAVTTAASNKIPVPNVAPVIAGTPPSTALEGSAYVFQPNASDADGDALVFSASNLPAWLAVSATTGRVSGTPPAGSAGTYSGMAVTVSDGKSSASLPAFSISVVKPSTNSAPVISGTPPDSVKAGVYYSFQPTITDADGDSLTLLIGNRPSWLTFNYKTGELSGAPSDSDVRTFANIQISAYDGKVATNLPPFSITVLDASSANSPPKISGTPATSVKEGVAYTFTPTASDPDGQALRFGIANMPSWATFDNVTGRLSGTPGTGTAGTYANVVISVSDNQASASLPAFTITVTAAAQPNRAPTISGSPSATVTEGSAYSFQPTASDPDGDTLTFSASGAPSWLALNGSTGKLSGTPPKGSAGTFSGITISVSDGKASASLPAFSIIVSAAPNRAPTISGTPATTVTVDQPYSFVPTASDPDGQTLGFGIANKPGWATFDLNTGKLSGTPTATDVKTFSNIVISVSDGVASATLPAFAIVVKSATPVVGSADLSWTAPTRNEDGSALTNLAGYRIRYGTSPGALNQLVTISSPATTSATIPGLAAGTWYFSVASYTNTGVESASVGPVYRTIE